MKILWKCCSAKKVSEDICVFQDKAWAELPWFDGLTSVCMSGHVIDPASEDYRTRR